MQITEDLSIPFGLTGTVIGVHYLHIIVLFDRPFIGGSNLYGRCLPSEEAFYPSRPHSTYRGIDRLIQVD
jgi:hypothetical protein